MSIVDATMAAAVQLRVLVRAQGVVGMPGVRVRRAPERGDDAFELVIEDRRDPGDEVQTSQGIRFYLSPDVAKVFERATVDVEGADFVIRAHPEL